MAQDVRHDRSLFVILPNLNIWNADDPGGSQLFLRSASRALHASPRTRAAAPAARWGLDVDLVDEVAPMDAVLVAMDGAERVKLLQREPGLRVVPARTLEPLWLQRFRLASVLGVSAGAKVVLDVKVEDAATGAAMAGVDVVGFVDHAKRVGTSGKTNARGVARLVFPPGTGVLDAVAAYPSSGYWPVNASKVPAGKGRFTLCCTPIDLAVPDARGHFGFEGEDADGRGVKVAVVDTGVSRHPDLRIARGRNVVKGERVTDFADSLGHGTHVAAIIAGRGAAGRGVRGVVPGADLHAYRVFGQGQSSALSFNIAKGIRQAVDDGCDLINLSLGGEGEMPDVLREIHRARAMGVVCLAATGNDYRGPVAYPAHYSQVLAVSAFGRKGTWPADAAQVLEVEKPFGTDRRNFVAAFSNVGDAVDLTGPGVGIVSAVPGGYAVMDGTSMACPVATGALARQLGRHARILGMERNQKRSDAIIKLALNTAGDLGFGPGFEGAGLLV
ncbi:S8 family peptidase [Paracidovorax anthurii]|uniref:Subtilisin n=1 Tax=Paracidovorax anthurii TaxID=78229 RepID=A0A328Z180_9BURK|nr:S8 family serine peptidase [Paracidovorax anthurii]RAR76066.1 subtilisin [Paracidovorax anthurii]